VVRLQRLDNRLSRANARTSFYGTAAFTAVFAVLAIVVTVVRAWHAGTPLVWVACVVWVALGCFLVRPGRGEVGAAEHRRVRRRPDRDLGLLRLTS
jgi:Flp pilus assembly protein TadB